MIGNRNPIGRGHHDYSYPRLQDAVGQTLSSVKVPMGLIDETMFTMFDVFLSNVDEHSDRDSVIHEIQRLGFNRVGAPRSEVPDHGVPSQALSARNATTRDRWHHAAWSIAVMGCSNSISSGKGRMLPSGELTVCYGKIIQLLIGKSIITGPCSIARVPNLQINILVPLLGMSSPRLEQLQKVYTDHQEWLDSPKWNPFARHGCRAETLEMTTSTTENEQKRATVP